MKLLLHIGPHKTGSTSVQLSLSKVRKALLEQGVWYFEPKIAATSAIFAQYASKEQRLAPGLLRKFANEDAILAWSRQCLVDLRAQAARGDADLCIISSEDFLSLTPDKVAELLRDMQEIFSEVTVLAYARDPVALYLSVLQQMVKTGFQLRQLKTPETFNFPLRRGLETYGRVLGRPRMIVRNFDRANLVQGDVVQDFAAVVGKIGPTITLPSLRQNESLPGAATAWFLTVNETWDRGPLGLDRLRVMNTMTSSKALAALPRLEMNDPGAQSVIRRNARADIAWINAAHLQGQIPLAEVEAADDPTGDQTYTLDWMRDWIMGYLTSDAMALIAREILRVT